MKSFSIVCYRTRRTRRVRRKKSLDRLCRRRPSVWERSSRRRSYRRERQVSQFKTRGQSKTISPITLASFGLYTVIWHNFDNEVTTIILRTIKLRLPFRVGDALFDAIWFKRGASAATMSLFRLESRRYTHIITAGKKELIQCYGEQCWEHRIHECDSGMIYGRISRFDCVSPVTSSTVVCFSLARAAYTFARTGWAAPVIFREGGEDASSLWGYGVWTAEEPWFTKRTRQNISRIVHVGAINQAGGSSRTDRRAPGPCFCNKVRVVSDLCAISPRHLPRTARERSDPTPSASLFSTTVKVSAK